MQKFQEMGSVNISSTRLVNLSKPIPNTFNRILTQTNTNTTQVIKRHFNICEISTVQKRNAPKKELEGCRTVIFIHLNQENEYQVQHIVCVFI